MSVPSRFRRRVLGVLAAVVFAGGLSAATAGPAQAQSTVTVAPGGTVVLRAQAGIAPCTGPASSSGVRFLPGVAAYTAPTTAVVGTTVSVVLRWTLANEPTACTVSDYSVEIVAEKPNAVRASFTPTLPPGPCIVVSSTAVDFGNVEQGGPWADLATPPAIVPCTQLSQTVLASATGASAAGTSDVLVRHATCGAAIIPSGQPELCAPGTNQMVLGSLNSGGVRIVIPESPSTIALLSLASTDLTGLNLSLRLGAITNSLPGTPLSFDVRLTAVTA